MSNALYAETLSLSEDLCSLLRQVDPSAFRDELEADARARAASITRRLRALVEMAEQQPATAVPAPRISDRLRGLLAAIERAVPSHDGAGDPGAPDAQAASSSSSSPHPSPARREAWKAFQREVQPAYESLALSLRGLVVAPPTVRPTNYTRSLFHVASGLGALALIRLLPGRGWLIGASFSFAAWAWSMEILRRRSEAMNDRLMRLFGRVAHPHERHRVNSSTWYVTALFLLAVFAPKAAAEAGVVVLAVADPAAALVGRRLGRVRLRANRSLEGTLAFFVVAALATFGLIAAFHPLALPAALALTLAAATAGSLAELFSTRLDDNFTIPVAVATATGVVVNLLAVAV